jgi:Gpi18-like mannosyltransferase
VAAFVLVGTAVRWPFLDYVSGDMREHFLRWYEQIAAHGWVVALRRSYSVYPPPYFYLLTLVTYLGDMFRPVVAVKAISFAFDFASAVLMYRLVRLRLRRTSSRSRCLSTSRGCGSCRSRSRSIAGLV